MIAKESKLTHEWNAPLHTGPIDDAIVVYPEIVVGNPCGAGKVVRWALNEPGLLGGETSYADEEMVFVYDPQKLDIVSRAVGRPLGPRRVLWLGLVDPTHIYPSIALERTMDCSFTNKGRNLHNRFPFRDDEGIVPIEDITPTLASLGDVLRRTRILYSYDHYSNILREAVICGCTVRVIGEDGNWHDPQICDCRLNILWHEGFRQNYAHQFNDRKFVKSFIREIRTKWPIPAPVPNSSIHRYQLRTENDISFDNEEAPPLQVEEEPVSGCDGAGDGLPVIESGPRLSEVRAGRGLGRAAAAAQTASTIHLVADEAVLMPVVADGNELRFVVPVDTAELRLSSPSFAAGGADVRRLGVLVSSLAVSDGSGWRVVSLDDPGLFAGFHEIEHNETGMWRWTDGEAHLSPSLWSGLSGVVLLRLVGMFSRALPGKAMDAADRIAL